MSPPAPFTATLQAQLYPGQPCPSCGGQAGTLSQAAFVAQRPNPLKVPGYEQCAQCQAVVRVGLVRKANLREELRARGQPRQLCVGWDIDGTLLYYPSDVNLDEIAQAAPTARPNLLALAHVKCMMDAGIRVVFITGRPGRLEQLTRLQLAGRLGVAPGTLDIRFDPNPRHDLMTLLLHKADAIMAAGCDVYVGDMNLDQTAAVAAGAAFVHADIAQSGQDVLEAAGLPWPSPSPTTATTTTGPGEEPEATPAPMTQDTITTHPTGKTGRAPSAPSMTSEGPLTTARQAGTEEGSLAGTSCQFCKGPLDQTQLPSCVNDCQAGESLPAGATLARHSFIDLDAACEHGRVLADCADCLAQEQDAGGVLAGVL
jgi:hypothetical protein